MNTLKFKADVKAAAAIEAWRASRVANVINSATNLGTPLASLHPQVRSYITMEIR